ncbi:MAG: hypothetical protein HQL27_00140 [Candidatus Omnitrophica bacterium]|nr:hypothetical protein [Candidatus Omnitrophota bacterium]
MIQTLRNKMAEVLTEEAKKSMRYLDKTSPLMKELKKLDIETILKEDIRKICDKASFSETTKIMGMAVKYKLPGPDKHELKEDFKGMIKEMIARVERDSGMLKLPPDCREMLYDL